MTNIDALIAASPFFQTNDSNYKIKVEIAGHYLTLKMNGGEVKLPPSADAGAIAALCAVMNAVDEALSTQKNTRTSHGSQSPSQRRDNSTQYNDSVAPAPVVSNPARRKKNHTTAVASSSHPSRNMMFIPQGLTPFLEFWHIVRNVHPMRLKFTDDRSLKGLDFFNWLRIDPLTGKMLTLHLNPDFSETHSLVGICGISPLSPPFCSVIQNGLLDLDDWTESIMRAVIGHVILHDDVLILKKSRFQTKERCSALEEWLWNVVVDGRSLHCSLLFLPRPDCWTPMLFVWTEFDKRMRRVEMSDLSSQHSFRDIAGHVMRSFSRYDVLVYYQHCGYHRK
jgi:hypothetical protein